MLRCLQFPSCPALAEVQCSRHWVHNAYPIYVILTRKCVYVCAGGGGCHLGLSCMFWVGLIGGNLTTLLLWGDRTGFKVFVSALSYWNSFFTHFKCDILIKPQPFSLEKDLLQNHYLC